MPVSFPSPRVLDMSGNGQTDGWVDEGAQARPPAAPGSLISAFSELFGADTTLNSSDGEWMGVSSAETWTWTLPVSASRTSRARVLLVCV